MDNVRVDRKYTHENRAQLLADIEASIKEHEAAQKVCHELKEKYRLAVFEMEKVWESGIRLQLAKDEFGIYICQVNYENLRAECLAGLNAPTHETVRQAVIDAISGGVAKEMLKTLIGKHVAKNVSGLTLQQLSAFYDELKLL